MKKVKRFWYCWPNGGKAHMVFTRYGACGDVAVCGVRTDKGWYKGSPHGVPICSRCRPGALKWENLKRGDAVC